MKISDCVLLELPKNDDPRGSLTVIEGNRHVPFPIERIFYMYNVPEGSERGGHALKTCDQVLIAMAGSFDVVVDDGVGTRRYHLDTPSTGLFVPRMVWRELANFSSGSVCLAVASTVYIASDYYHELQQFYEANRPGH